MNGILPNVVAALDFSTLPQQVVNGLLLGAIYALIALGYTMVYGVLKLINFAHGEVYMLGAYVALLTSWKMGYTSDHPDMGASLTNLVIMFLACIIICAIIGILIERFAYRPMRNTSRIASLITAIGVSLFLQYGGALVLPVSPPPSISDRVNPYTGAPKFTLKAPDQAVLQQVATAKPAFDSSKKTFDDYLATNHIDEFNLPPAGITLRDKANDAERTYRDAQRRADISGVSVTVQTGQIIMFGMAVFLMIVLRILVMNTPAGRAMRAVSHDFDSASLMGINVNKTIVFTFALGSGLAGAGAMMTATFLSTPLTTFYGMEAGVKAFTAAVLGGIGNVPGAVLGGLLMGVAEYMVVWAGYSSYRDAIAFVILIIVLLFKPGGLLGSSKVEKV